MYLVVKLISSPLFWVDVALAVSGGIVVWWGLKIEKEAEKLLIPSDFKPDIFSDIVEPYKAKIERGWRILMIGIVMEVVAAFLISVISGLEIADLTDKAGKANERAALIESNNLVLQTNVESLNNSTLELAHKYDLSTNALAEANARLAVIRPLKERLIENLNKLGVGLVDELKTNSVVAFRAIVATSEYISLKSLSDELGAEKYILFRSDMGGQMISNTGMKNRIEIEIKHALVEP